MMDRRRLFRFSRITYSIKLTPRKYPYVFLNTLEECPVLWLLATDLNSGTAVAMLRGLDHHKSMQRGS